VRIASIWRIIRDVDLDGIRAQALAPFEIWMASDDMADADAVAALLSPSGERHPWLVTVDPRSVPAKGSRPVVAAILVSRTVALSEPLTRAREALTSARIPVVTVIVGHTGPAASARGASEHTRVAVTAIDGSALAPLASALLDVAGADGRIAVARQLGPVRPILFETLIHDTAWANASFAFTTGLAETVPLLTAPLNVGDMVVLTKNQLMLGYRIVLASGKSGEPRKLMREILGVLGGGLLFRQIARQLVGLIPVAGIVPKVAIAYSGTWAIGRALAAWANEGRVITKDLVRAYTTEAMGRGRAIAGQLLKARSGSG
jgi:uncharacterized protein (DUF697 family)